MRLHRKEIIEFSIQKFHSRLLLKNLLRFQGIESVLQVGKRTGRCIFRRHDLPRENVAIAVHLFLLVFLDDLENPSFAHRFYPLARFSSGFHEFREPEPEPLGERDAPSPRDQPPRNEYISITLLRIVVASTSS